MKFVAVLVFIFLGKAAFAGDCPDLSGHFKFVDQPWNGSIEVEQHECARLKVTRVRPVAVSPKYPLGSWTEARALKADGLAYVGYADASLKANSETVAYHKVTWESGRLVLRHYFGSKQTCGDRYAFNSGRCHVTEYILNPQAEAYAWTQKGLWFSEGATFAEDRYALVKTNDAPSTARVAKN